MLNQVCPICESRPLVSPAEAKRGACDLCAADTGIWIDPPDLRPHVPCVRCNHGELVCSVMRERTVTGAGDGVSESVRPLAVSFDVRDTGIFRVRRAADGSACWGLLVAYVCRRCGFTELYATDPAQIPIGPRYGTRLIDVNPPASDGPFR
jgi:hypothetical protein